MGQRNLAGPVACVWALLLLVSCDGPDAAEPISPPATRTFASLVPAATDLLLGMQMGDRLVAISNFDTPRPELEHLPRVGDYRTIDWEQLASLRPSVMIVQYHPDKMPAGLAQRAAELNIELLNVRINRLDEVYETLEALGAASGDPAAARTAADALSAKIAAVSVASEESKNVPTLVCVGDDPLNVVGRQTFLDDILSRIGGQNVVLGANPYPTLDREQILQLDPHVVINLLPGASQQSQDRARAFWEMMPEVSAAKSGRIFYLTESYVLLPGFGLGDVAERLAECVKAAGPDDSADLLKGASPPAVTP